MARTEMLRRLTRDLKLSADQRAKVDTILKESHERNKILWELLAPEFRAESQRAVEEISAELTPQQRERFETLLRQRQRQRKEGNLPEKRRPAKPPGRAQTNTVKLLSNTQSVETAVEAP